MFPYPSGNGLHVGHWRGYISDVWSRYKVLQNYYVLPSHGLGCFWAACENDAIKGIHPRVGTEKILQILKDNFMKSVPFMIGTGSEYNRS